MVKPAWFEAKESGRFGSQLLGGTPKCLRFSTPLSPRSRVSAKKATTPYPLLPEQAAPLMLPTIKRHNKSGYLPPAPFLPSSLPPFLPSSLPPFLPLLLLLLSESAPSRARSIDRSRSLSSQGAAPQRFRLKTPPHFWTPPSPPRSLSDRSSVRRAKGRFTSSSRSSTACCSVRSEKALAARAPVAAEAAPRAMEPPAPPGTRQKGRGEGPGRPGLMNAIENPGTLQMLGNPLKKTQKEFQKKTQKNPAVEGTAGELWGTLALSTTHPPLRDERNWAKHGFIRWVPLPYATSAVSNVQ